MIRYLILLFALAVLVAFPNVLAANAPTALTSPGDVSENPFKKISGEIDNPTSSATQINQAEDDYIEWSADFSRRSWEWHLLSTKIIFVSVILIVLFGVWNSWLQFRVDIAPTSIENKGEFTNDVTIEISKISVKSKTIGAIILLFAGAFFYLYISVVYPMTTIEKADAKLPDHSFTKTGES